MNMHDDDLTPAEKKALDSLPREREPSDPLQDQVVRALRQRHLLRSAQPRTMALIGWRLAGGVAASILLLVTGFVLGRWSSAEEPLLTQPPEVRENGLAVALSLQGTGTEYVTALEELAASMESTDWPQMRQDREVALTTLYAAVDRMARIVPRQQLVAQFLLALEAGEQGDTPFDSDRKAKQLVSF